MGTDLNDIAKNALLHFLNVGSSAPEFPLQLQSRRFNLERIFVVFKEQWRAACKLESAPDVVPALALLRCPSCPRSWKRAADWKKHLLIHEKDHEQQWLCNGSWHKSEPDFYKHHSKSCLNCGAWTNVICRKTPKMRNCDCVRCRHANQALSIRQVRHACGFCSANIVFERWDDYCSHLRGHFEVEYRLISDWSHFKVVQALVYQNDILSQDQTLTGIIDKLGNYAPILNLNRDRSVEREREVLRHELQSYSNGASRFEIVGRARRILEVLENSASGLPIGGGPLSPSREIGEGSIALTLRDATSALAEDSLQAGAGFDFNFEGWPEQWEV
ncbi:hypothetical protein OQA88_12943 [Cercophora sp. LCS_1]